MRLVDDLSGPPASMVDLQHPASIINNLTYGAFGVSGDSLGNGIGETFGYSTRGALSSYGAGPAYGFNLGFASNYNITSANDSVNGNWTYSYDQFNRLASSMKIGVNMTYAYDRFGNRWQQNGGGGPTPQYVIDTNNHITNGGYSYDALGNLTTDNSGHTFVWDAENRLASVNGTSYVYDAFGRRVKGASNEILYDLDGHPVIWLDATNGNWAYGEIYAGNRHVATYSGGTTNFLHTDWLGTKRVTTSVTGANSETCTGLPFGDGNNCTGTNWSYLNFTDLIHDFESNTEHTLFRQLSTTQGRWLSPDPAGLAVADPTNPQSWNQYAYVLNNPISYIDPNGLCEISFTIQDPKTGAIRQVCLDPTAEVDSSCKVVVVDGIPVGNTCNTRGRGTGDNDRGGRRNTSPGSSTSGGATSAGSDDNGSDTPIYGCCGGQGSAILRDVGLRTAGFTKAVDCVTLAATSNIPFVNSLAGAPSYKGLTAVPVYGAVAGRISKGQYSLSITNNPGPTFNGNFPAIAEKVAPALERVAAPATVLNSAAVAFQCYGDLHLKID